MGRQSRRQLGRWIRALGFGLALAAPVACSPIYRTHGYAPTDAELAAITPGVDTRETVADAVGTPSSGGVLRDSGYYYVSQRMRTYTYHEPEVVEREVVAISFDKNGVVTNIERYGLKDGNVVALSRRTTAASVENLGFLRQLLGNIGALDIGSTL
ncbi:outer membrane protein assembly factor BamE [Tropicimonas sp. IMCC34043]|uniref:outer membrane protein assembly factor BamE n=1 Tax=Tropicimonas sp. IMCC34043 TaxID=2248760 RepID=UPI000E22F598|nr:outer membrane protein assembly factor BamE [Tropicimonas sp. IMCC34043]